MIAVARLTRLAWAGFLGAALLGFSYLFLVEPVGSRTTDSVIALGIAAAGAAFGVWLATRVERLQGVRHAVVPQQETESMPAEAVARH
jgi:hypothetical protein